MTRLFERFEFGEAGHILYSFIWDDYCDWYIEMTKEQLQYKEAANTTTKSILVFVLDWDAPKRTGVLFDLPSMKRLIEETVSLAGMQERASVMTGDFTKDDIGGGYDLILCHSIMLFAIAGDPDFFARLRMALNPGGLVVCVNEGIEPDYSGPWDMILGYMAFNLQGMPIGVLKGQVADMAKATGSQ